MHGYAYCCQDNVGVIRIHIGYNSYILCSYLHMNESNTIINDETFEGENFCGFHGFSINHESFPTNFNTRMLLLFLFT